MIRAGAVLGLLAAVLTAAPPSGALPADVEEMQVPLAAAERRLQDATLALAAARRDAEPASQAAAQARAGADGWLGRWRLRRALADLKDRLDRVEKARVERAAARNELFLLLTGVEEEMRGALEKALGRPGGAAPLASWWAHEQGWSRRLEALEAAPSDATDPPRSSLLAQARVEQLERDVRILAALRARGALGPAQARADGRALADSLRRWRRAAGP